MRLSAPSAACLALAAALGACALLLLAPSQVVGPAPAAQETEILRRRNQELAADNEALRQRLGAQNANLELSASSPSRSAAAGSRGFTPAPETAKQTEERSLACLVAVASVASVVLFCVVITGCCRQTERNAEVPAPATKTLDGPELWEDRDKLIAYTQKRLELESRADLGCLALLFNRPWRRTPGLRVCAPKLSSNSEWLEWKEFPNGETRTEDSNAMVVALWKFLSRKKRRETYLCCFLMFVMGCCPAASAQLLACITDEINAGTFGSEHALLWYSATLLLVNIIQTRANYVYEVEVPGASVRWEVAQRLQRQFLGMRGDTAKAWPAGRCSAVQTFDVIQAVNLTWESLFVLTQAVTNIVVLSGVMLYNNRHTQRMLGTSSAMLVVLFIGAYANLTLRRANCLDLAKRRRDWQLAMTALGAAQIREKRQGRPLRCEDEAAEIFGDAALIFRKRAFHYFFIRLVATLACTEMTFVCQAIIAFVAGCETMHHQMTVGQAVALIAVVNLLSTQLSAFVTAHLDILEGYASLLDIAEVFNAKEVSSGVEGA